MKNFDTAISFNEQLGEAHYRKALLLREKKEHQNELSHFLRATQLSPSNAAYWYELGQTYQLYLSSPDLAEHAYRNAVLYNPDHPFAYYYLGQVVNDNDVKLFYYEKAKDLNPNHVPLLIEVARLQKRSNPEKSVKLLKQALHIEPFTVHVRSALVQAMESLQLDTSHELKKIFIAWEKAGKVESFFDRSEFFFAGKYIVIREYFEVKGVYAKKWEAMIYPNEQILSEESRICIGSYLFTRRLTDKYVYHIDKYTETSHETFGFYNGNENGPNLSFTNFIDIVKHIITGGIKSISNSLL